MPRSLLALLFVAACSAEDDSGPLTRGEICDEMAAASCARGAECGSVTDEGACRSQRASSCCDELCEEVTEFDRFDLTYCVAAFDDLACGAANSIPASCPTFSE
jgi:hypothetical protein